MRKRILFTATFLLFLAFLITTAAVSADPSAQLEQAEQLFKKGQYEQAEQIYLQVAADYPGSDYAFAAEKGLVILYIKTNEDDKAQAALENLLAKFSGHPAIVASVTHVADAYRDSRKYEQACDIYDYVIDNWSQDEHAMWSQMGLAISNIWLGKNDVAEAAFEKLRTNYSGHPLLGRAVCLVADNYRSLNRHKSATEVYQCALANQPDAEFTLWSLMGLAISSIRLGNYDTAAEAVEILRSDFSQDQRLSIAACLTADEYRRSGKHQTTRELYQYVIDNWPAAEHALWSRMGLAMSNLWHGDHQAADNAADKLLAEFAADGRVAVAACLLADQYRNLGRHRKASQLYRYVVENWPDAEHAVWSQMGLAISSIRLGDDNAAWAAIQELLTQFSQHKNIAQALQQIGQEYRRLQKYDEADEVHRYTLDVLNSEPEPVRSLWSQAAQLTSTVALASEADVGPAVDDLIADFSGDSDLAQAVFQIGQQYYYDAFRRENLGLDATAAQYFAKAIVVWERIIAALPANAITPDAYYFSGRCYERLGQFEKALERYQVVVDKWPDYEFAWNAQFMIACCWEQLTRAAHIPLAEGAEQIRQACQNVLSRYPQSMAAPPAGSMLRSWQAVKAE